MLPQVDLKQPAIPSVDQEAVPDISRFNGRWKVGAKLYYSSPKGRCGYQTVEMKISDGQVRGNLRLIVGHYKDSAAGDYRFSGTADQAGNIQAKGHGGLSISGVISDNTSTIGRIWNLSSAGCRGTYNGSKEF